MLAEVLSAQAGRNVQITTNPGGEYKVWVSNDPNFTNSSTKTDNFKVKATPPPPVSLCVDKFYDANVNGIKDNGEVSINGWQFKVFADDNLYLSRESPFCVVVDPGFSMCRQILAKTKTSRRVGPRTWLP